MRKMLCAVVLALALYSPAFAGDIPMPPVTQPPPGMKAEEPVESGDISTPLVSEESLTQSVMSMLESLLALI